MLNLRELTPADEKAFFEGLKDWKDQDLSWYTFAWKPGMSFAETLAAMSDEKDKAKINPSRVPATMYYGFVDQKIIGRLHIRHELNDHLHRRGGHFGYAVAEKYRGKGYATEMVKQALPICRQLGIKDALITCGDTNLASCKIIEKFGGKLENKIWDEVDSETIRRYWIHL